MDDIGIRVFGLATEELINIGQFVSHSDGTSLKPNPSSTRKSCNVRSPVLHSASVCCWFIVSCTSFLATNASYRIPSTPVRNDTVLVADDDDIDDKGCKSLSSSAMDSVFAKTKQAPMAASAAKAPGRMQAHLFTKYQDSCCEINRQGCIRGTRMR